MNPQKAPVQTTATSLKSESIRCDCGRAEGEEVYQMKHSQRGSKPRMMEIGSVPVYGIGVCNCQTLRLLRKTIATGVKITIQRTVKQS